MTIRVPRPAAPHPGRVVSLALAGLLALTGCTGGDDPAGEPATPAGAADTGTAPAGTTTAPADAATVTAVDYAYEDTPGTMTAGTTVTLQNDSEAEAHEIVALRIDDGEDRSAEELMSLPPDQLMQVAAVQGVALAPPGGSSADAPAPPLVLDQPGRYVFACLIPTDAPPAEVLEAAQEFAASGATEGAPDYPDTGPPHAANGMFTEVTVTGGG